jgi:iron complex outermembrane receptor protein
LIPEAFINQHLPAATASLNWYATPNITPYLTLAYAENPVA